MQISKSKKQIIVLYSSTILGVILGVFISILNTRHLCPTEYGDVRYVNNIISFFSGILLFGYFTSGSRLLALSETKEQTSRIKGALILILGITVVILICILAICGLIHNYFLHKTFYDLFYCVLPVCGSTLVLNYVNTSSQGDNSIYTIAIARVLPQFIYLIVAFFVYKISGATSEKMLMLQNGIYFIIISIIILKNNPSFTRLKETLKDLKKENKQYGLQVYYGSLANVSVQYIAGITLGLFGFDNTNVGFYSLALTVTTPLSMLPNVIGTTFFKHFAHQNSIDVKILKGTMTMSVVSLIGFMILIFPIVNILYDKSYENVALFACFLAFSSTLQGLGDVFNRFLGAHGKGRFLRNGAWASGTIAIIGYILFVYLWGINGAIMTRIASSLTYLIMMAFYYMNFKKQFK